MNENPREYMDDGINLNEVVNYQPSFPYPQYTPLAPRVHIRWMIRRDLPEVLAAEWNSYGLQVPSPPVWSATENCYITPEHPISDEQGRKPWGEDEIIRCLRKRNCIGMVAERGQLIHGFMIYELFKYRLHLLRLVVHPAHQRQGIGRQLIAKLVAKLSSHRRQRITIEVRESCLAAQKFLHAEGFRAIRVLRDCYEDSGEDSYLMEYRLAECSSLEEEAKEYVRNRLNNKLLDNL